MSIRAVLTPLVASGWRCRSQVATMKALQINRLGASMNPFSFVTRPVKHVADAFIMPFRALFVVGITGFINAMTFHGVWWFKWVALGMGIAVLVAWARAAKTLLLLALVAWVGTKIYKRYGAAARQAFDEWVTKTQPQAAQVLQALRQPHHGAGAAGATGAAGTVSG
jgi:hypothetical protein